jgi:hypothetical protein
MIEVFNIRRVLRKSHLNTINAITLGKGGPGYEYITKVRVWPA